MRPNPRALLASTANLLLLLASLVTSPALVTADGLPFDPATVIQGTFGGASTVAVADIDRDGDLDVVGGAIDADDVSWWENRGADPWVKHTIYAPFDQPLFVATGDLDNDGWTDVVAVGRGSGTTVRGLIRCKNLSGLGGWGILVEPLFETGSTRSVAIADLDNDGLLDVVAANSDRIIWLKSSTSINTTTSYFIQSSGFDTAHSVFVGDIDGDGWLDVAGASFGDDEIAWWRNDGSIECDDCWVKRTVETSFDQAISVTGGDFDRDGDLDLAAAAYGDDQIAWFRNLDGDGSSWQTETLATSFDGAYSAEAVDLDLDGDLDLLGSARLDDEVSWWENRFPGPWTPHPLDEAFDGAHSAVAGDLDGDGDPDVIAAAEFADQLSWWENRTIHRHAVYLPGPPSYGPPASYSSLESGDLDNDGDLDLFATASDLGSGPDVVIWAAIEGVGWSEIVFRSDLNAAESIRGGDFDGDGDVDLVVAAGAGSGIEWYENMAWDFTSNTIAYQVHTVDSSYDATEVEPTDFDGDGDLDVLGIQTSGSWSSLGWWENVDGNGTSWSKGVSFSFAQLGAVRAGDLDRDGDIDVAVSTGAAHYDLVWFENSDGDGTSWNLRGVEADGFPGGESIDIGDLDGDGWQDLISVSLYADTVAWWRSLGGTPPTFERHDIATNFEAPVDVLATDLDQDGDLDVAAISAGENEIRWWRNFDAANVWVSHPVDTDLGLPTAVTAADIDGDGDADLAAVAYLGQAMTIYPNRGGQHGLAIEDISPPILGDSEIAALLRLIPSYLGWNSDPDMEFRALNLRFDRGGAGPLTQEEANGLIESLGVYHDANRNSVFEPGLDSVLLWQAGVDLEPDGTIALAIPPGGLNPPLDSHDFESFFLVVETAPTATQQLPGRFRVTHLWDGLLPAVHYLDWPTIPLAPSPFSEVSARVVTIPAIFSDGFESGNTSAWTSTTP